MTEEKRLACEECGQDHSFHEWSRICDTVWQQKADGTWIKGPITTSKPRELYVRCPACGHTQSKAWAEKFRDLTQD